MVGSICLQRAEEIPTVLLRKSAEEECLLLLKHVSVGWGSVGLWYRLVGVHTSLEVHEKPQASIFPTTHHGALDFTVCEGYPCVYGPSAAGWCCDIGGCSQAICRV